MYAEVNIMGSDNMGSTIRLKKTDQSVVYATQIYLIPTVCMHQVFWGPGVTEGYVRPEC